MSYMVKTSTYLTDAVSRMTTASLMHVLADMQTVDPHMPSTQALMMSQPQLPVSLRIPDICPRPIKQEVSLPGTSW